VTANKTSEQIGTPLAEIDELFSVGGLRSNRRKRAEPIGNAPIPPKAAQPYRRRAAAPVVLRVPAWRQYGWLAHGFSTRMGGVSTVYRREGKPGELNLGFTPADVRENVVANRERFLRDVLGDSAGRRRTPTPELTLLRQIHSGVVHGFVVGASTEADLPLRGDGWIAAQPGRMLAIQTADCLPVLVADVRQRIVAAFHAGWRGTLARIVERGVGRMRAEFGSLPGDLTAAIGPGIGRCCYSVGEEVRMEFSSQFAYADALFGEVFDLDPIKQKYPMLFLTARAPGHSNLGPSIHLDLAEANRRQLMDAGLAAENIHSLGLCTACDTERFFSHRAEQGFTGRMLSVIGVMEKEAAPARQNRGSVHPKLP